MMTRTALKRAARQRWGKDWRKELIDLLAPYAKSRQASEVRVCRYLSGATPVPVWVSEMVKKV